MVAGQRRQRPLGAGDPRRPTRTRQGLTRLQLAALLNAQRGLCALCAKPLGSSYSVDHDHLLAKQHGHNPLTGCPRCTRGVLHPACNTGLGQLNDDPELLLRAAKYVTRLRRAF
jgi:hypothetical protein